MENNQDVAYQGVPGAYSEMAVRAFFPGRTHKAYETFDAVIKAVQAGEVFAGALPIENSSTGAIRAVYSLLTQAGLKIIGEQYVPVHHCLMVLPGTRLEEITDVYSHPEALRQCVSLLDKHRDWTHHAYINTAKSAEKVALDQNKSIAALASKRAAEIYGLEILAEGVQDQKTNTTRFVLVAREADKTVEPSKTSMILRVSHQPGSLVEALMVFSLHGFNLMKIESHPAKEVPWEYDFFIDVERSRGEEDFQRMLAELKQKSTEVQLLGSYRANPLKM